MRHFQQMAWTQTRWPRTGSNREGFQCGLNFARGKIILPSRRYWAPCWSGDKQADVHEPKNSPSGVPIFRGAPPPNQQKVAKDAPPKNRQPVENCRVRAQARLQVASGPFSSSTVRPASTHSAANSCLRLLCRAYTPSLAQHRAWSPTGSIGIEQPAHRRKSASSKQMPMRMRADKSHPRSEIGGCSGPGATSEVMSTENRAAIRSLSLRMRRGTFALQHFSVAVSM